MSSVVFYKDKPNNFNCTVKINGASLSESKARLVLSFSDKSIMYKGTIDSNGNVKIQIPALKENYESGKAVLEIIAESTFFEAWTSPFTIESKKSVQIESVNVNTSKKSKVIVENVSASKKIVDKKTRSIFKENVSSKNRKIVNAILETYSPKFSKNNATKNDKVLKWISETFKNPNSGEARYCGLVIENRLTKKK